MLKRLSSGLISPTAGVVYGVLLATLLYGLPGSTIFGIGLLIDPPGAPEAALLVGMLLVFPGLIDHLVAEAPTNLLTSPLPHAWMLVRGVPALVACLLVARWARWQFRRRSDPDALLGTLLTLLPVGATWWLVMLAFQLAGTMDQQLRDQGYHIFAPMLTLGPALLVTLVASLFQRFGSGGPAAPWRAPRLSRWHDPAFPAAAGPSHLLQVTLEPTIRGIEIDRTGTTLLGSIAALLASALMIMGSMIALFLVAGSLGDAPFPFPSELLLVVGWALGLPLFVTAFLAALRLAWPAGFRWLLVALVVAALGVVLLEPLRIAAIVATGPAAAALKQRLVYLAAWTVPAACLVLAAWLHAALRYPAVAPPQAGITRASLALSIADLAGLPRLILALGWRNFGPQAAAMLGLVLQAPLRLAGVGLIATGGIGLFLSPLAHAKYALELGNAACSGTEPEYFTPLRRILVCPGTPEFDLAMGQLAVGPPLLSIIALPMVVLPALVGLWLGRGAIAASARRYQRTASTDLRPPVFYLRPFHLDRTSLKWRPRLWSTLLVPRPAEPRSIDEIVLDCCIADGPVVAFGQPGEPTPPLGASRRYVGTGDWQEMVLALAEASRYVVIAVEPTDGVVWEVEQTISRGWANKTLYLLSSARTPDEAWRMVRSITGRADGAGERRGKLRPIALTHLKGEWLVLQAKDVSRLAVVAAVSHFRQAVVVPA